MSVSNGVILVVDDSSEDLEMTTRALRRVAIENPIVTASDGADALDYLHRTGRHANRALGEPILILLDIKMPKVDGFDVLRELKSDPKLAIVPTVIFTSSTTASDVSHSYNLGASAFVQKPVDFMEFFETVARMGKFWADFNTTAQPA
jgi:CheY-like chemotaxis protein